MNRIMIPMFPLQTQKIKKRKTHHTIFLTPNRFSNLDFDNDVMIMENNSHDKDPGNYTEKTLTNSKIP